MVQMTIEQALATAIAQHQAGRLGEAEVIYRQILARQPNHADALHLLGLIAQAMGQNNAAIELIQRALAIKPDWPEAVYNLGCALNGKEDLQAAIGAYQRTVALRPKFAVAWNSLGNALKTSGRDDESMAAYRQAIISDPAYPDAHNNLANALRGKGEFQQAIAAYRRAIEIKPNYPEAHSNLGVVLQELGRMDEAIHAYRRAIELRPGYMAAYVNLGRATGKSERWDEAIAAYQQAIVLDPNSVEAFVGLGNTHFSKGQLDEAIAAHRRAIALRPDNSAVHNNLGIELIDAGQVEEALLEFDRAIALEPGNASFGSARVSSLHYLPGWDGRRIAEAHFDWNRRYAEPLVHECEARPRELNPNQRLRIGYVSADFRSHPVGRFLLPSIEHHDRSRFEIHCYSDVKMPDDFTAQLRGFADGWHEIAGMSHDEVAKQIRKDAIDILVDLSGHTSGNRLPVFARKPSPVQISYLGYPGTTGLSEMDYRLTDAQADPPGMTEHLHSEKLIRLPRANWCFVEPENSPAVVMGDRDHVRFCSFSNFTKVTDEMLKAWGEILQQVPGSKLVLKARALASKNAVGRVRSCFVRLGIEDDQVIFRLPCPDQSAHLATYAEADIALDTFPYHGTTTTCEALWMGVPVITLAGQTHVSRVGVSLLNSAGLPALVAASIDEYVKIAVDLAKDRDRLASLRGGLRDQMRRSALMDAKAFVQDVEAAFWNVGRSSKG